MHRKNKTHTRSISTRTGGLFFRGILYGNPGISRSSMRTLSNHAIIYLIDGSGFYADSQGKSATCRAGSLLFLFPGIAHAYGAERGGGWDELFLIGRTPLFQIWEETGLISPENPVWQCQPDAYWRERMQSFLTDIPPESENGDWFELGKLTQLLAEASAGLGTTEAVLNEQWLLEAKTRLKTIPLDLQDVSSRLGLSYENFRKKFKDRTGMSPKRYHDRYKIDQACRMLSNRELSVKEVANHLHYCDPFHFSRQFKQWTGLSPRDFQNLQL